MEVKKGCNYVCPDLGKEFNKYDTGEPSGFKQSTGIKAISKKEFSTDVGYDRALGPAFSFSSRIC